MIAKSKSIKNRIMGREQVGLFDEKLQKLMVSLDANHDGAISKRGKQTKIFIHI